LFCRSLAKPDAWAHQTLSAKCGNPFVVPPSGGKRGLTFTLKANQPASAERRYYQLSSIFHNLHWRIRYLEPEAKKSEGFVGHVSFLPMFRAAAAVPPGVRKWLRLSG
jgi:hypothetical protein